MDEGVAALVMAREEVRGGLAAKIAVDALLIDIELARDVLIPLVGFVSHKSRTAKASAPPCQETTCRERADEEKTTDFVPPLSSRRGRLPSM